ncbi:MAG: transcriptional repressor LexA [Elainellaceae cyanobacterium]
MTYLSQRSQDILEWIQEFWRKHQFFPTYRDIQRGFGYKSVSAVQNHIRKLKEAGLVVSDSDKARTLRLTDLGIDKSSVAKGIPIVGMIAAGSFVDFFPEDQEEEFISESLFSWRSRGLGCFALRVDGDSMIGANILKGDIVVLDKPDAPNEVKDRSIVAARVDGENRATLKRWHKSDDRVFLIPENPDYSTLEVHASQVLIEGVYIGLIRDML